MAVTISRDPFARSELQREVATHGSTIHTCDWCGQAPAADTRGRQRPLFRYVTHTDGGRVSLHRGEFCGVGCFRAYHS